MSRRSDPTQPPSEPRDPRDPRDPREDQRLVAVAEAIDQLNAALLQADEDGVLVGYAELELRLDWPELAARLAVDDAQALADGMAEAIIDAVAQARSVEEAWPVVASRVVPVLVGRGGGPALARRAPDLLALPFAEALLVILAFDVPGGRRFVLRSELAQARVTAEEAVGTALVNLRRRTAVDMVAELDGDRRALDTGDGLDSSRLLILDELAPDAEATGVLAVVPAREVLAFAPFTHAGCRHLRELANLARNGYQRLPLPLTDSLFYIARDTALRIGQTTDDDGAPRLQLPRELADVQARLIEQGVWE